MRVSRRIAEVAQSLLDELEQGQLEVVLVPAQDKRHSGHCVRAVQNQNARWYQKFCSQYVSGRKGFKTRTRIKRRETVCALEKLSTGEVSGVYGERLLEFIKRNYFKSAPLPVREKAVYEFLDFAF